jgi:hypothetical protein
LSERLEKHVRQKVDIYFENAAKEKSEREVSFAIVDKVFLFGLDFHSLSHAAENAS